MIVYSNTEGARIRELISAGIDDPQEPVAAYQARQTRLRQYADQFHDPDLREKSYVVVNLDDKMLQTRRQTVLEQGQQGSDSSSDTRDFQRAYTGYAAQSQQAGQVLQAACPR